MTASDVAAYIAIIASIGVLATTVATAIVLVIKAIQDTRITILENTVSSLHQQLANETTARQASDTVKDSIIASLQARVEELVLEVANLKVLLAAKTAEVASKVVVSEQGEG